MTRQLYMVDGRVVPPDELVQTDQGWVEPAPVRCPAGHILRPGHMEVGWAPCSEGGHRTHRCECGATVYTPPLADGHECSRVIGDQL